MSKILEIAGLITSVTLLCCDVGKLAGGAGAGNPPQADVTVSFKANSTAPAAKSEAIPLAKRGEPGLLKSSGVVIRNPDSTFTVRDSSGAALTLSAIEAQVQTIGIMLPKGLTCAEVRGSLCKNDGVSVEGPYAMDLMTGMAAPSVNFIKLPAGLYSSIGLKFVISGGDSGTAIDSGHNITIKGRAAAAGQAARLFEIKLNLRDGLDFQDTIGLRIEAAKQNNLVLKLDVDGWFKGVNFAQCLDQAATAIDSAGTAILQGDNSCGGVGYLIRKNIEASGEVQNEEQVESL